MNLIQAKSLRTLLGCCLIGCLPSQLSAQSYVALTHAKIETVAKAGTLEDGTLLIRDGKIVSVGPANEIDIPITARIIDARGKTLMPGIVDPYFVVDISRNPQATTTRTVTFGGRTIVIGGSSPAIATTFAKIADAFDASKVDWNPALRSGITTVQVVTGGYAQSLFADLNADGVKLLEPNGNLLLTVTNSTSSLDVLRSGIKGRSARSGSSSSSGAGRSSGGRGRDSGGPPASRGGSGSTSGSSASANAAAGPTDPLWANIREGKSRVFINVNNAASILHVETILHEQEKAQLALVASGADALQAIDALDPQKDFIILAPSIDLVPNSTHRVNVPQMLTEKKIDFAFSLSLGQSDFRAQQDAPLFAVAMLVRSGLDRNLALQALTLAPAKLLGMDSKVGTLEAGKMANLVVLDGDPFASTTSVSQVIIEGKPIDEN